MFDEDGGQPGTWLGMIPGPQNNSMPRHASTGGILKYLGNAESAEDLQLFRSSEEG